MLTTDKALEILLSRTQFIRETETLCIENAVGRICAKDVYSDMDVPPYPRSAMDGYAVNSHDTVHAGRDTPELLTVIGELDAGDCEEYEYRPRTAVRIMTGAYIPPGFDAVIKQEDTDFGDDAVNIYTSAAPYMNYCPIGEDIKRGQLLVKKGDIITPVAAGVLAGAGYDTISVIRTVKADIISTGSELTPAGKPLGKGKIYNSIGYMLSGAVRSHSVYGIDVGRAVICGDDEEALFYRLSESLKSSDIIITTGGVSVGKRDIVPRVLERLGAEILFKGVDIQPGTPTMASIKDNKIILSLSGNPYAAMANFELYFWDSAAKMTGNDRFETIKAKAVLGSDYNKVNKHKRRVRAYAENGIVTVPNSNHRASVISDTGGCNCFVDIDAGRQVKRGDTVDIVYFKWSMI